MFTFKYYTFSAIAKVCTMSIAQVHCNSFYESKQLILKLKSNNAFLSDFFINKMCCPLVVTK